ncbi:MAG: hypothetical protein GWO79_00055, partial [Actinobacteria bacterium]|nr:hypothetical protein [Actinomycetota bacterium]
DQSNNAASSTEYSFTTLETLTEETAVVARETAASQSSGGGVLIIDKTDKTAPVISNIETSGIKSDSAMVSWATDEASTSFVEYGENNNYDRNFGKYGLITQHSAVLNNLLPETQYNFKVASRDSWGNLSASPAQTFTTLSFMEELAQESEEETAGEKNEKKPKQSPFDMARQAIKKAWDIIRQSSSDVSLTALESALSSQYSSIDDLSQTIPPPLMSGEPKVTITATTAAVEWRTDKESNSLVAIAAEDSYDPNKESPYREVRGNPTEAVIGHTVIIYDLEPDTVYHYQVRSEAMIGPMSKSGDFTFKTMSETIEITNYAIERVSTEEAVFKWVTSAEADSILKYTPYRGNVLAVDETKIISNDIMTAIHEATVDDFESGVVYDIELSGADIQGNTAVEQIRAFSTAKDDLPPKITRVRTDSAISPGKTTKVQTIISWFTNEPSTSRVYYQKGFGKKGELLDETTRLDKNYTKKHVAVITKFDPGAVYQFRVESIDSGGNVSSSKTHTILTPRQKETVFQIIMKNIEDIFGWVGEMR